jgi:hypothetical protein
MLASSGVIASEPCPLPSVLIGASSPFIGVLQVMS